MSELSWQRPGWGGWPWLRRGLFLPPLAAAVWAIWAEVLDYTTGPLTAWLAVMAALVCWLAFSGRPCLALAAFLGVFTLGIVLTQDGIAGYSSTSAWILALAMDDARRARQVIDLRPVWDRYDNALLKKAA